MEDQENWHRRTNLRIGGLLEPTQGEDLTGKIQKIFNPILGKEETHTIKIERAHRIRRLKGI